MDPLYQFLAVIVFFFISWIIHYIANSHPLTEEEKKELATHRRFFDLIEYLGFEDYLIEADNNFKKNLKTSGGFYSIKQELKKFPSLAASLLKGKKHEWRIVAFSHGKEILGLWANKGENNQSVSLNISVVAIIEFAKKNKADLILDFHNHTNAVLEASETDVKSATYLGKLYLDNGIDSLAFVVARGNFKQYSWWVNENLLPVNNYLGDIEKVNGIRISLNYNMRMELRRKKVFKKSHLLESASSNNIFT